MTHLTEGLQLTVMVGDHELPLLPSKRKAGNFSFPVSYGGAPRLLVNNQGNKKMTIEAITSEGHLESNVPGSNGSTELPPFHVAMFSEQETERGNQTLRFNGQTVIALLICMQDQGQTKQIGQFMVKFKESQYCSITDDTHL